MKTVLIIGCGWLGKITGKLLAHSDYPVTGTTRDANNFESLIEAGITPLQLNVTPDSKFSLPQADVILISISPNLRGQNSHYVESISLLAEKLSKSGAQVLMCSSTSVYDEFTGTVVEKDLVPKVDESNAILSAEYMLKESIPNSVLLRLGEIYGYERHPVYFLSGRKEITRGDAPVNLIHVDDAAAIIEMLIQQDIRNEILNLVAPIHPSRNDLYCHKAREFGLEEPGFLPGGEDGKRIDSTRVSSTFGYEFIYPNPMDSSR